MTGIDCLAIELLREITKHVANPHQKSHLVKTHKNADLYSLRSTCTMFNCIAGPILFSHIILDVSKTRLGHAISQLESLATGTSTSHFIRSLEIRGLDPLWDRPSSPISYSAYLISKRTTETEGPNGEVRLITELLGPAIASLQNLNRVSWNWSPVDPVCAESVVIDSLLRLSTLEELDLKLSESHRFNDATVQVFAAFRKFAGLRRISIMGANKELCAHLGNSIVNCPNLSSLEAGSSSKVYSEATPCLYDLLGRVSKSRPLHLQHLVLTKVYLALDDAVLRHLKFLTSLQLRHCFTPESSVEHDAPSFNHIWTTLRTEGIHLTSLDTDTMINAELIHYIASYSGLERLQIDNVPQLSTSLAAQFFQVSVPRHARSLIYIHISPQFKYPWSFSDISAPAIIQCQKLEYLSLRLDLSKIPLILASGDIAPEISERVDKLVKFSEQLPRLQDLVVAPTGSIHAMCYHIQCVALRKAITEVPAIDPSTSPPKIKIGSQSYTVQWNRVTSDFRYCHYIELP